MSKNIDFWRKNSYILHFKTVDFGAKIQIKDLESFDQNWFLDIN